MHDLHPSLSYPAEEYRCPKNALFEHWLLSGATPGSVEVLRKCKGQELVLERPVLVHDLKKKKKIAQAQKCHKAIKALI